MLRSSILRALSVLPWALALGTGLSSPPRVLAENAIRGSAENLSLSRPAAGDDAMVFDMDRLPDPGVEPRAVAQTKTDAQGAFLLPVPSPGKVYLVRVVHQGVVYDQRASAGDSLSVAVFDARPRVPAITGSIEILRLGTRVAANQKLLHVTDMLEIRNQSHPPVTQAGAATFEVYLPAKARIDSVLAASSGSRPEAGEDAVHEGAGLKIPAAAVSGEPGHYSVNFPLRPGATRFAFNYDLPYQGRTVFETRHEYAFQQFAVMMPRTMRFSSPSSAFRHLASAQSQFQVQAVIQLKAGPGPEFEVSGDGSVPSLPAKEQAPPHSPVSSSAASPRSAATLAASVPRSDSKSQETPSLWRWLMLAGSLLLACLLVLLRWRNRWLRAGPGMSAGFGNPRKASPPFLDNLKEELFQLEVDRIRKSISSEDYSSARLALEKTFKRTARAPSDGDRMVGARSRKAGKT